MSSPIDDDVSEGAQDRTVDTPFDVRSPNLRVVNRRNPRRDRSDSLGEEDKQSRPSEDEAAQDRIRQERFEQRLIHRLSKSHR